MEGEGGAVPRFRQPGGRHGGGCYGVGVEVYCAGDRVADA